MNRFHDRAPDMGGSKCFLLKPYKAKRSPAPTSAPPMSTSTVDPPAVNTTAETVPHKLPSSTSPSPLALQTLRSYDLRQVFDHFDVDRDGKISAPELESVLRALGSTAPIDEARVMVHAADADGDGHIGVEEFLLANRAAGLDEASCTEDLRQAFAVYDQDGDGLICASDVHRVLKGIVGDRAGGIGIEDCQAMVRAVDGDGDGAVCFDEFLALMTRSLSN